MVYMADGVRWDHHPAAIREQGATFRTVAGSLHTPTSIASLLTGLYLPGHGIRGFTDNLPQECSTIFNQFDNTGLSDTKGNFNEVIYRKLLSRFERTSIPELEEPFSWFMRDAGGHAPYNGFDDDLQTEESVRSYLTAHGGDVDRIKSDYAAAIDASVDRFERFVLEPLRERDLLDRTLIVYVSDHGQLLGEYGHVGESYPACPEIAYVPTTLIHPSLEAVEHDELMRHVDLLPTIAGLIDKDIDHGPIDGVDILEPESDPDYGACFYDRPYPSFLGEFSYTIDSIWDRNGGHVFVESNLWDKCKVFGGFLTKIPAGTHWRRARDLKGLWMLFENERTWGTPSITKADARQILGEIKAGETPRTILDLDERAEENLRELGYL